MPNEPQTTDRPHSTSILLSWDLGPKQTPSGLTSTHGLLDELTKVAMLSAEASAGWSRHLSHSKRLLHRQGGRLYLSRELPNSEAPYAPRVVTMGYSNPWYEVLEILDSPFAAGAAAVGMVALARIDAAIGVIKKLAFLPGDLRLGWASGRVELKKKLLEESEFGLLMEFAEREVEQLNSGDGAIESATHEELRSWTTARLPGRRPSVSADVPEDEALLALLGDRLLSVSLAILMRSIQTGSAPTSIFGRASADAERLAVAERVQRLLTDYLTKTLDPEAFLEQVRDELRKSRHREPPTNEQ